MQPKGADWYRRPGMILSHLISSTARGEFSTGSGLKLLRAIVLAVDHLGGKLQNENGSGSITVVDRVGKNVTYNASVGVSNPCGSVKARIITNGRDRLFDDNSVGVFWPLFSSDQLAVPVSVGEHVYVLFEDDHQEHGLWLTRVSGHDDANSFKGSDSYTLPSSPKSSMDLFETNEQTYDTDDRVASLAPIKNVNELFDG